MLKIYGHSDDLVEIEGDIRGGKGEEINIIDKPAMVHIGGSKGIVVQNEYTDGGWETTLRFGADHEDKEPMPWKITVEMSENGYSLATTVDCPPDTDVQLEPDPYAEEE